MGHSELPLMNGQCRYTYFCRENVFCATCHIIETPRRCVYMSKEDTEFITDEFGIAIPVHAAFTLVLAQEERLKKWYSKETRRLKRVMLNKVDPLFYPEERQQKKTTRRLGAARTRTHQPFIDYLDEEVEEVREPINLIPPKLHRAPGRAGGAPGRRRRAANMSRRYRELRINPQLDPGERYRLGWNYKFTIKPLSPKHRPYHKWPRN